MGVLRRLRSVWPLILALVAGCGGGSTSAVPPPPTPAPPTFSTLTTEPPGDAVSPPGGGTPWDIAQVATSRLATGATQLTVTVTFVQLVSAANLPPPGSALTLGTQIGAGLLFNTGTPGNTVNESACTGSPAYPNITYALFPGAGAARLADGNFIVGNIVTSTTTGEVPITFTGPNSLTYTIPLSAIGGGTGATLMAVVVFNGNGVTDCVTNLSALIQT
jgi:hypothetical protein